MIQQVLTQPAHRDLIYSKELISSVDAATMTTGIEGEEEEEKTETESTGKDDDGAGIINKFINDNNSNIIIERVYRSIGDPDGQISDYRIVLRGDPRSIHIKEYDTFYKVHWDYMDPSINPILHILLDAPHWLERALDIVHIALHTNNQKEGRKKGVSK